VSFIISPTTAASGATITATGKTARKRPAKIFVVATEVASFTTNSGGSFTQTFKVPILPDGSVVVTLKYLRTDNVWAQTAWASLTIKNTTSVPTAPTGFVGTPGDKKVTLNWGAVTLATTYKIYRDGVSIGTSATPTYTDTVGLMVKLTLIKLVL
jgi:hypothetical protein